nr:zf-CCHC domain-containing protein/UBN2 domain-containing protein [Tanacetum cinerariifolium]
MTISVISISSNSSEESVGTPAGRAILFVTILTTIPDTTPIISPSTTHTDTTVTPIEIPTVLPTIPPSPDHTPALPDIIPASPDYSPASPDYSPASPDYSPASPDYSLTSPDYSHASDTKFNPYEDPPSNHIPPLPAISPFLSSADDATDIDTPDTPPSPTHDESIDSAFARFNTIITSIKAFDESYSSKNYVRKFLRALHPKWIAKVMTIKESKDLTSLSLDELIGNLKVHEMIIKKDSEIVKAKVERKSIALKAKNESSDEECRLPIVKMKSTPWRYDDKDGKSDRKCFRCGDPNHLIRECPKPLKDKNQRTFVGGSWSDNGEEDDEKVKDETCLVAHKSSEVCSESSYFNDENSSIDDLALDNEYDKL